MVSAHASGFDKGLRPSLIRPHSVKHYATKQLSSVASLVHILNKVWKFLILITFAD
jgi:hypothetical protein